MNGRYIFKFATKKAGCKGPDIYNGDVIWDESDGPVHLKFWSGNEYVRLSDMVRNEVDKYMKETNRMNDRPTPETDALDHELHSPCVLQDRYSEMRDHARKMERERDEAREEWGKASMDAAQLLSEKTKVMVELDEAREENKKFREALEWIAERYDDSKPMHAVAMDAYEMSCTARAALRKEESK